jgi:hypothetical protein
VAAPEVQTRQARCEIDGPVRATREIPALAFPFVVYAFLRWRAKKGPYICPICERPVETGS